jgi:hypothetical protein
LGIAKLREQGYAVEKKEHEKFLKNLPFFPNPVDSGTIAVISLPAVPRRGPEAGNLTSSLI